MRSCTCAVQGKRVTVAPSNGNGGCTSPSCPHRPNIEMSTVSNNMLFVNSTFAFQLIGGSRWLCAQSSPTKSPQNFGATGALFLLFACQMSAHKIAVTPSLAPGLSLCGSDDGGDGGRVPLPRSWICWSNTTMSEPVQLSPWVEDYNAQARVQLCSCSWVANVAAVLSVVL